MSVSLSLKKESAKISVSPDLLFLLSMYYSEMALAKVPSNRCQISCSRIARPQLIVHESIAPRKHWGICNFLIKDWSKSNRCDLCYVEKIPKGN